jgi:hypothetical protein
MKRRLGSIAGCLVSALFFQGTADGARQPMTEVWPVKAGQSQIVFVHNSHLDDRPTFLYETTSGSPKFLGMITNKRKFVLDLPPGDHVFMMGNLPLCDFLQASVMPDNRYYVVAIARFPDGMTLRPVRHQGDGYLYGSQNFMNLLTDATIAGRTPEKIMKEEMKNAEKFYPAKWAQWQTKTPEQKAVLTLLPADAER